MNDIHDTIYERLEALIPDLRSLQQGEARVSKSEGFMDLHLDVLESTEDQLRIALHHSFEQNGDLVSDPDMEIRVYLIDGWKKAEALTYQDQLTYQMVYPQPNLVDIKAKKELNQFLAGWLKNCIDQGHSLQKQNVDRSGEVL